MATAENSVLKKMVKEEWVTQYLMILPLLVGFILFSVYPILYVFRYSFFYYDGVNLDWVGLENYVRIFRDEQFWLSVQNTFILMGKLIVEIPLALFLAVVLSSALKGRLFFRLIYFMPSVISTAIIGLLFFYLFGAYEGIINNALLEVGLINRPIIWFNNRFNGLTVIIIASIWQNFGLNMVFFLAGLQSIPGEMYECADLDGASNSTKFFRITLPMLAPFAQKVLLLAIVGSFLIADLVIAMTYGGPAGKTDVMMSFIYKKFFKGAGVTFVRPEYGYASALSFVAAIIIGLMTWAYIRFSRKVNEIY